MKEMPPIIAEEVDIPYTEGEGNRGHQMYKVQKKATKTKKADSQRINTFAELLKAFDKAEKERRIWLYINIDS